MLKDQLKKFWQSKGFYVALTAVIIGSVIASYLAVNTMLRELGSVEQAPPTNPIIESEDVTWNEPIADVEVKEENLPVSPSTQTQASSSQQQQAQQTQPSSVSSLPSSSSQLQEQASSLPEPANLQATQTSLYSWPVQGNILQAYSGDELVYNETMGDWRTHNGVDIAAEIGSTVVSPATLTVASVTQGGEWAGVVTLESNDITVTVYGLNDITVKQGQSVKQGAEIGKVAHFAAEMTLDPHIHVEVQKNGTFVNPEDIFNGAPVE